MLKYITTTEFFLFHSQIILLHVVYPGFVWLFQTYALENAEGSEIKECRPEETGVGGTIGGETTEAAEGVRYTVRYVQTYKPEDIRYTF